MHDTNNSWQSQTFREMLNYERLHCREKFVYEAMNYLDFYQELLINKNLPYYENHKGDPQLITMIFAFISLTHNKDTLDIDFEDYSLNLKSESNSVINYPVNSMILPEANIDLNDTFQIPESTLTAYYSDSDKMISNLNDWDFEYNNRIISINNGVITSLTRGTTLVKCTNKVTGTVKTIKVNSGESRNSHIQQFLFTQIRNVIAHGKYKIYNTGRYDTVQEYDSFNVLQFDERYKNGLWREIALEDSNQLNLAYGGNNYFNADYVISCAKQIYKIDNNQFYKFVKEFYDANNDAELIAKYYKQETPKDLKELLLLSKFYISFIYNYDTKDKNNFDYTSLNIDNVSPTDMHNHIYEIRTAIMHGRYSYDGNKFSFWNTSRNDPNTLSFSFDITYDDLEKLIKQKQTINNQNMIYDPNIKFEIKENKKR